MAPPKGCKECKGPPLKYDRHKTLTQIYGYMIEGAPGGLVAACERIGELTAGTVYGWVQEEREAGKENILGDILSRAQEAWCYAQLPKMVQIADDSSKDVMEVTESYVTKSGDVKTYTKLTSDNTAVNRAKVRIDVRKWAMTKLSRKIFGDVIENQITGKDGAPFQPVLNIKIEK